VQAITVTPDTAEVHIYRAGREFVRWAPPHWILLPDPAAPAVTVSEYSGRYQYVPGQGFFAAPQHEPTPVPHAVSSRDWYYGKQSFVPPALIGKTVAENGGRQ
jgi:hypothetical protein